VTYLAKGRKDGAPGLYKIKPDAEFKNVVFVYRDKKVASVFHDATAANFGEIESATKKILD
jgi:hypothetical protein